MLEGSGDLGGHIEPVRYRAATPPPKLYMLFTLWQSWILVLLHPEESLQLMGLEEDGEIRSISQVEWVRPAQTPTSRSFSNCPLALLGGSGCMGSLRTSTALVSASKKSSVLCSAELSACKATVTSRAAFSSSVSGAGS